LFLDVIIDQQRHRIDVPEAMLAEAGPFLERVDRDMDGGWQMSSQWVETPDATQRCQIAADRLAQALETASGPLQQLMAAYILSRLPGVRAVAVDTTGQMEETTFQFEE